jgi:ubiquinone/menaquinone biosynthesis C-methylase UbiE
MHLDRLVLLAACLLLSTKHVVLAFPSPTEPVNTMATSEAQKWSKTVSSYVKYFEPSGLVVGRYMISMMKLQFQDTPPKVLEAGCGAGGLAKELLNLNGLSLDELHISDISDGMLEKTREKLSGYDKVKIEQQDFTKFNVKDVTFDRYLANICLHYAEDPDVVIREASRILKPNGICGFTVWGKSSLSPLMTIVPDVLDDFGLAKKDLSKRSSFHLGEDDEALRQKFLTQGFNKACVVHIPAAMEWFSEAGYEELIIDGAASTKKQVEEFSETDQKRVRSEVRARAKKILDAGQPMVMDIAIVVAQKGE